MRLYLILLFCFFTQTVARAQEIIFSKQIELDASPKGDNKIFASVSGSKNQLVLGVQDKEEVLLFQLSELELQSTHEKPRPKGKYNVLLGNAIETDKHYLFWTNSKRNALVIQSIDLISDEDETRSEVKFSDEKIIGSIGVKSNFYVITSAPRSIAINVHRFEGDEFISKEKIRWAITPEMLTFDQHLRPSLDKALSFDKVYHSGQSIYVTNDNNLLGRTKVVKIDPGDLSSNSIDFPHNKEVCRNAVIELTNSNSYIYDNQLFQIIGCPLELGISIIDIRNGDLIKQYTVKQDEAIVFNNGHLYRRDEVVQEMDRMGNLDSKSVIPRIAGSSIGLTAYEKNDTLQLTIGGRPLESGSGMPIGMPGNTMSTPHGNVSTPGTIGGPMIFGKGSSTSYFISLLDPLRFDHLDGEPTPDIFDQISVYVNQLSKKEFGASQVLFMGGDYYLYYYDKSNSSLVLVRFSNS